MFFNVRKCLDVVYCELTVINPFEDNDLLKHVLSNHIRSNIDNFMKDNF